MTRARLLAPVALLAALVAIVVVLSSSATSYGVTGVFQQAYGLIPGARVLAGGVKVGQVSSITLGRDRLPRVAMQIDESYHLHQGATAAIEQLSNSGEVNRYVTLSNGSGPSMSGGGVIPSTQTDEPVEVDQVLSTLNPATRAEVRSVLANLDSSSQGLSADFRAALHHSQASFAAVASDLGQVTQDGAALRTLVSQSAVLTRSLASQRSSLAAAVEQLSGFSATSGARESALALGIARLPAGLRSIRTALDTLHAAVPNLEAFVQAAAPATRELGPTFNELTPTLIAAKPALQQATELVQRAPGQLVALGPLLRATGPMLNQLAPALRTSLVILDYLRVYTPEVAGILSNWTSMTGNFDRNGHTARILATTTPPPNVARPLDSNLPGLIPAPYTRAPGSLSGTPWNNYQQSFLSRRPPG
jgi:phospholipid/cholesterol/gamma-HCH transport system substrate-binding protein